MRTSRSHADRAPNESCGGRQAAHVQLIAPKARRSKGQADGILRALRSELLSVGDGSGQAADLRHAVYGALALRTALWPDIAGGIRRAESSPLPLASLPTVLILM